MLAKKIKIPSKGVTSMNSLDSVSKKLQKQCYTGQTGVGLGVDIRAHKSRVGAGAEFTLCGVGPRGARGKLPHSEKKKKN